MNKEQVAEASEQLNWNENFQLLMDASLETFFDSTAITNTDLQKAYVAGMRATIVYSQESLKAGIHGYAEMRRKLIEWLDEKLDEYQKKEGL